MFYVFHSGKKRTPLSILNAVFAHSLGRGSKIFVKSLNRQGMAISYSELRRYQHDLASFTINHNELDMKLPSHFDPGNYTSAAIDNWDHEGAKSSEHDTVCVLFQHKPSTMLAKPKRSDTCVIHGPKVIREKLQCQNLKEFEDHTRKYELPLSYRGHIEPKISLETRLDRKLTYVAWSLSRLNLEEFRENINNLSYPTAQCMPSWSASNSLWSPDIVPVKEVAFAPVIPHNINNPKVIYTVMNNIKATAK